MNPAVASNEGPTRTALANPDILELILDNLDVDFVWKLPADEVVWRRKVLAAVALTCRTFKQPALDRLWRSLDKLFPLFKLLPAFYRSDSTFVLRGHVSETDWERFDSYAGRVKSFCYTRDPDSLDIAMHVYFRIAQLRKKPLLPSLRHLRCPHISQDDFLISSICLFLTPSLRVLDFDKITGVEDKLIGTFLHTLLCEEARIERVMLVGDGLTRDTLGYLGKCVYLRSLIVSGMGPHVDLDFVKSLGRIPGLEVLHLDLEGSRLTSVASTLSSSSSSSSAEMMMVVDTAVPSPNNSGTAAVWEGELGYRELTELELIAPLSFIKSFVVRIGATQLRHIWVDSLSESEVERREFFGCIVQRWKETLTYFRMVHTCDEAAAEEESPPPAITMDTLSPLLKMSRLTHLELDGYLLELRDSNITEMAMAWPKIHTLHLPFMVAGTPRPTVISLQTLSTCCPDLKSLVLPLDTSGDYNSTTLLSLPLPPSPESRNQTQAASTGGGGGGGGTTSTTSPTTSGFSLHKLHMLTVAGPDEPWELARAMRLARVVDHLFPCLAVVQAAEPREGGGWQQVYEMVKMCQSVRTEAMQMYSRQNCLGVLD